MSPCLYVGCFAGRSKRINPCDLTILRRLICSHCHLTVCPKKLCTTLPPLPLKCFNNSNHFRAQEGLRCISQLSPSLPLVVTPDKVRPRNYHLTQTVEHLLQGQQHQDYHQYCQVSLQCHHYCLWVDIYHLMFYILHYWSCYTHLFITFLLFHGSPCANEKWICVYLFLSAFCWNW